MIYLLVFLNFIGSIWIVVLARKIRKNLDIIRGHTLFYRFAQAYSWFATVAGTLIALAAFTWFVLMALGVRS